jgi:hypothetical protein
MGCACKVQTHINRIEKYYGTKVLPNKKTDIANMLKTFCKKVFVATICLPFIPIILVYTGVRKMFTNKPIVLDNLIKKKI